MVNKIETALGSLKGKTVGVLGLTFKPNTSDVRESPAIDIVRILLEKGAKVKAYDPAGMDEFKKVVTGKNLFFCQDAYQAAKGADALVFLTEWNELRNLDLEKLQKIIAQPLILDLRNIYDSGKMRELGYTYIGVGRGI